MALAAIALLFASTQAVGQKIYKCKGSDGSTIYQQIQCLDQDGEVVKVRAQPSQATIAEAQARLHAQEEAEARSRYEQTMLRARTPAGEHLQPAPAVSHHQPPPAATPRPSNPSRYDPENVGFSSSRGYEPLRYRSSTTTTTAPRTGPGYTEPKRIRDQYGNFYSQPPGSSFARDEKTGKQCFVNGAFIQC